MKILVTGGAGFIASHIVDTFVEMGHDVFVLDDLSHGKEKNLNKKAKFVKLDVRDGVGLEKLLKDEKFDVVDHHAAQINVRKSVEDPMGDAGINILGSLNIIQLSAKHKVKRFIFASTGGALYGEPKHVPVKETDPKCPLSPYGLAKWTVEQYLFLYHLQTGLEYIALRYGNVYGPRQDPEGEAGVIAIFIDKVKKGERPIIFGDGRQTRDYVYVGDVAEANARAATADYAMVVKNRKSPDDFAFHVGTGVPTNVNDLWRELKKNLHANIDPMYDPPREGEVQKITLDAHKSSECFGLKNYQGINDGLSLLVHLA